MAEKIYNFFNYFFGLSDRIFKVYDPYKVYNYSHKIYVFSGFWKYRSVKRWKTKLYKLYQNSVIFAYGVSIALFAADAIEVRNDLVKLSFNMSSSVLVTMKILQIILLWNLRSDVDGIHDKLDNNLYVGTVGLSEEDKNIMKGKAEIHLNISLYFYGLLIVGLPLRVIADTALDTRAYLIPMPFKENIEPYYAYLYGQQVIVSFHFMMTTLAYDLLGFTFLLRFIGHFEILEKNFLKIKTLYPRRNFEKYVRGYVEINKQTDADQDVLIRKTNYSEKVRKYYENYKIALKWVERERCREEKTFQMLKENINHHQKLITLTLKPYILDFLSLGLTSKTLATVIHNYISSIRAIEECSALKTMFMQFINIEITNFSNIYSRPLLVQMFGMVILVGIAALQILFISSEINPLFLQQILYACTVIMNIVYLSSFGSELYSKSISAAYALYDVPWYDMNTSNRATVYLMMKKLLQAPVLKGGGMITIDRVMCVKFMQTAYNMVALLRNKI